MSGKLLLKGQTIYSLVHENYSCRHSDETTTQARFDLLHGIMGLQKLYLYQLMNSVGVLDIVLVLSS